MVALLRPLSSCKWYRDRRCDGDLPFTSADEMLHQAEKHGLSLGGMILRNELAFQEMAVIDAKADQIWRVMSQCMERGFATEGILEGD